MGGRRLAVQGFGIVGLVLRGGLFRVLSAHIDDIPAGNYVRRFLRLWAGEVFGFIPPGPGHGLERHDGWTNATYVNTDFAGFIINFLDDRR